MMTAAERLRVYASTGQSWTLSAESCAYLAREIERVQDAAADARREGVMAKASSALARERALSAEMWSRAWIAAGLFVPELLRQIMESFG